jgi:hypothetical protein
MMIAVSSTERLPESDIDIVALGVPFLSKPNPWRGEEHLSGLANRHLVLGRKLFLNGGRTDDDGKLHSVASPCRCIQHRLV